MSWRFYEVLTFQPDFSEDPRRGIEDERDTMEAVDARTFMAWPGRTDKTMVYQFQTLNPQEWRILREFFDRVGGRARAFYLPSWCHDFELAEAAAAGTTTIVVAGHWHTDNVTEARPDTLGRRLFFYNHLGQFATAWVESFATDGDNDLLVLGEPLALDMEAGRTAVGFCYLARLTNDNIESQHASPGAVRVEVPFREITQTRRVNQQESAPGAAVGTMKAAFDIIAADADPLYTNLRNCDAVGPFLYAGPQAEHFQSEWTAELDPLVNTVVLHTPTGGLITSPLYNAPAPALQIALAFDAASREVLAWELDNEVTIAWNAGGIEHRLAFTAYSPVAYNTFAIDATATAGTGTVAVFYLKKDDNTIFCRIGSESYATEHRYVISPLAPMYLHAVRRFEGRLELVGMDSGHRLARWRSAGYLTPPEIQTLFSTVQDVVPFDYRELRVFRARTDDALHGVSDTLVNYISIRVFCDAPDDNAARHAPLPLVTFDYISVRIFTLAPGDAASHKLDTAVPYEYKLVARGGATTDSALSTVSATVTLNYGP